MYSFGGWRTIPTYSWGDKRILGAVVPLLIAARGLFIAIIKDEISFRTGRWGGTVTLYGNDVVLLGILFICVGLYIHFHYFWGNTKSLEEYDHAGKVLSLLACCIVIFWLLFRYVSVYFAR